MHARFAKPWQSMFMNRGKTQSPPGPEPSELAVEVESLRNEVRVLRQAIDEVREELQYLNTNGVRLRDVDQIPPSGILKRMATDVNSSEWSQRLQIVFGTEARTDQNAGKTNNAAESQSTALATRASAPVQPMASLPSETMTSEQRSRTVGQLF